LAILDNRICFISILLGVSARMKLNISYLIFINKMQYDPWVFEVLQYYHFQ